MAMSAGNPLMRVDPLGFSALGYDLWSQEPAQDTLPHGEFHGFAPPENNIPGTNTPMPPGYNEDDIIPFPYYPTIEMPKVPVDRWTDRGIKIPRKKWDRGIENPKVIQEASCPATSETKLTSSSLFKVTSSSDKTWSGR